MMTNKATTESMMRSALRLERGIALLTNPAYKFKKWDIQSESFFVHNGKGDCYMVSVKLWECSCEDFGKHKEGCKHLYACEELLRNEALEASAPIEEEGLDPYIGTNLGGYDY